MYTYVLVCLCKCVYYLFCGCNKFVGIGIERLVVIWCVIVYY